MGAWGAGIFENDVACDWASELEDHDDLRLIEKTLGKVLHSGDGYIEADSDSASEALAACEVLARLQGERGVSDSYTESADVWISAHASLSSKALVGLALGSIDRIMRPPSELLELWDESDDGAEFREVVRELRERLAKHGTPSAPRKPWWKFW
jgi:hypothetical protein